MRHLSLSELPTGLPTAVTLVIDDIYTQKAVYSKGRLQELRNRISESKAADRIPGLTIFVAGSYARHEASAHSDLDPFFVCHGDRSDEARPHTNELEMFGDLIRIGNTMNFPKFSGDSKYLEVHAANDIRDTLGSREDDARNHFTLRLLMLLESKPLFGDAVYEIVLTQFVDAYFRDYPDHQATFEPTFLINDIARYWRTVLANYEHLRNQRGADAERIEQKVRNYKLKYSRLTTCFATIAALSSFDAPVGPEQVLATIARTPRERLELVADRVSEARSCVQAILDGYAAFLQMTELPTEDLQRLFRDKTKRAELFSAARAYGDEFFGLLATLDRLPTSQQGRILRTLVV